MSVFVSERETTWQKNYGECKQSIKKVISMFFRLVVNVSVKRCSFSRPGKDSSVVFQLLEKVKGVSTLAQ